MKTYKITILIILLIFIMVSVFSIVLAYKVISNFSIYETYDLALFKNDVEFSLVIMIANVIGDIFLFSYLWKSKVLERMLNLKKEEDNVA